MRTRRLRDGRYRVSRPLRLARCLVAALIGATVVAAALGQSSVTLAWDPSPSGGIAGYRLHFGGASGNYTNVISGITSTSVTVPGLIRGGTYFFAVKACNTYGQESDFSNEISYTIPKPSPAPPSAELTSPVNGAVYTAPATITLAAAVTAGSQTIRQVEFYDGEVLIGVVTAAPYVCSWTNVGAGSYSISAVAVYHSGGRLSSSEASVTVVAVQPPPAVTLAANAGVISAPFTSSGGTVFQSAETGLAGSGRAVYSFTITNAGHYTVSAVVSAPGEGRNSFYVNIDGEPTDPLMIWDIPLCSKPTRHTVSWRGNGGPSCDEAQYRPKVFSLSAGSHQLIVRGREANTLLGGITVAAVPPRLTIQKAADGAVVLSGTGQPSQTYRVLGSEDLTAWRTIGTATTDATGVFQFSDPDGSSQPRRMYRLLSVPAIPARLQLGVAPGGLVTLNAVGQADQTFIVQRSRDLQSWTSVGTMTLDATGRGEFTDTVAQGRPKNFYRLQEE